MKRKIFSILFALVLVLTLGLVTAVPAGAAVVSDVWVDDNAETGWYDATHFATIQEGINAVDPLGTVNVAAGEYNEAVVVPVEGLTIKGESLAAIVDGGFSLEADFITIDGLTVKNGFGGGYAAAIWTVKETGPTLATKGHRIINNDLIGDGTGTSPAGKGTAGISDGPDGSDDLVVANNAIHGWKIGVSLNGACSGHEITGNNIYENRKAGIQLYRVNDTTIEGNNIHDNTEYGILLYHVLGFGTGYVVHLNNIVGNGIGVENDADNPELDATYNWWGSAFGPYDADGTTECLAPHEGGWNCDLGDLNKKPEGQLGDKVSENVAYCPWLRSGPGSSVSMTTSGEPAVVGISVMPTSIDFGVVSPGATVPGPSLTIRNSGNVAMDVDAELTKDTESFYESALNLNNTVASLKKWLAVALGLDSIAVNDSRSLGTKLVVPPGTDTVSKTYTGTVVFWGEAH